MPDDDRRSVGVRVRPNSHDFIRQLRQDLSTKKYTFYVDVRANTNPATRDVRTWANSTLQKIHAAVPVSANTGPATRDMADWRRRQAGIRTTINVHADTSSAVREIEMVRAMAKDVTIRVKADAQRARAAAERSIGNAKSSDMGGMLDLAAEKRALDRFRRNVDSFVRQQRPFQGVGDSLTREISDAMDKAAKKKVRVDVDATPARKTMRDLLENFGGGGADGKGNIKVGLQLDDEGEYRLRQRLKRLQGEVKADPIELPVEADIKNLERQIMAQKIIEKSNKLKVPVEYDATDIKQMRLQLTKLRLIEESNDIKLRVNVSRNSLEQAKMAMDRFSKQFGNFNLIRSLDFGPFNLGKPSGLIGTVSTLTILAGLLPGAVAGATALADALTRMAGAAALVPGAIGALAASLATLSVGTKGIGDAFDSLFAMWDEGASQQAKSGTRMVAAQNNYTNAVVDEQRAQERVADARRQALGELRNLNLELRGGVLNEAQALLDLQKAKDRYAQGDFENNTERLQAQLDIQRAELNISKTREDNIGLQQKANEANQQGVEGSDAVRDALDAQRRAADNVTQALEALNAGGAGATTAAQKFQDQLSQLSPNAQDFVMTLAGMKDEIYNFRNAIQDTIFQGAGPAFRDMFNDLLPVIQPGMEQIAKGLNANILEVFDTLKSPDGQSIIERILGGTAETQQAITKMINPLITGVGTFVAASTEHMPQVIDLFTRLAERFAIFIEKADQNGTLDTFLDKGVGALADMAEIGLNLIQIVNDLSEAFGGNILTDIKHLTDSWHEFLSSDEGQAKLKAFLQEAKDLWGEWKPVLMELPGAFAAVSDAAKNVLGYLLPTIENILGFLNKFPGAIEAIATALIVSRLLGSFSALAKTVGFVFNTLTGLPALIQKIPAVPGAAGTPGVAGAGGAAGILGNTMGALAAPAVIGAVTAGQAADAGVDTTGQFAAFGAGAGLAYTPGVAILPLLMRDKKFTQNVFGNADLNAKQQLLDAIWKKFEERGKTDEDARKLYGPTANGKMSREDLENMARAMAPGFMSGGLHGYTDWGSKSGRIIEAHGGEYIEPKPTVDHYGVDAMRAVHQKKAVISYDAGGSVPRAYPGNPQVPYGGVGGVGGGLGWYVPGIGFIPGASDSIGPWNSPFYGKKPKRDPNAPKIPPWMDKRRGVEGFDVGGIVEPRPGDPGYIPPAPGAAWGGQYAPWPKGFPPISGVFNPKIKLDTSTTSVVPPQRKKFDWATYEEMVLPPGRSGYQAAPPAFADGGLVYDPNTGQYVPVGSAVSHGQNPMGTSPGIIDSVSGNVASGLASSPFADSFLGSLGIPGLSAQGTTTGPGWSEGGPPIGLGGGDDGFDIRKFGIGPGPVGSGPNDWMKFTGETLGKFGSSLVNTFMGGILGGLGLSGLSSYVSAGGGIADHFLSDDQKSKAQGPGADLTNAQVTDLLNTSANMPGLPGYPGVPALVAPFDPATGSAVGSKLGGLQPATARGEAAIRSRFPWATNIGGVRADNLKWHPMGLALDVMTDPGHGNNDPPSPEGLAKGNQLYAWLKQNQAALGIDYILWQEKDHYNHLHVNFAPSGPQGAGGGAPITGLTLPGPMPGATGGWGMASAAGPTAGVNTAPLPGETTAQYKKRVGLPASPVKQAPGAQPPKKPAAGGLFGGSFDRGGWLMPGTTIVHNHTGKPEWAGPVGSFAAGGFNTGLPPRPPKLPRPPDIITKTIPPPKPLPAAPKPAVPAITPQAPPVATAPHIGTGAPPGPEAPPAPQGPGGMPINLGPVRPATGTGPGEKGIHTHPALEKGITSGFATAGNIAGAAASMGMGGMGGGMLGGFVSGLFGQAGKIANNIANVASSFLVGNITGGTTENPYGVTQRGNVPTGGSRVVDASNNQYGDVYTNNLDEYFKQVDRRNAQKAQSELGRWGTQV